MSYVFRQFLRGVKKAAGDGGNINVRKILEKFPAQEKTDATEQAAPSQTSNTKKGVSQKRAPGSAQGVAQRPPRDTGSLPLKTRTDTQTKLDLAQPKPLERRRLRPSEPASDRQLVKAGVEAAASAGKNNEETRRLVEQLNAMSGDAAAVKPETPRRTPKREVADDDSPEALQTRLVQELDTVSEKARTFVEQRGARIDADYEEYESFPKSQKTPKVYAKVGLFDERPPLSPPLLQGLQPRADERQVELLQTWRKLEQEWLTQAFRRQPRNGFEEMIEWTKEGKLWPYPIDNELASTEKDVSFDEHVFLDGLIDDFPKTGPIRHFMELVVIGLAKNSYISVEKKHEHVDWFRRFFAEKQKQIERLAEIEARRQSSDTSGA